MRKGRIIINYGYGVICIETMRKTCKYLEHTVSELRFKTENYEIWPHPIVTNFLLVISHKYITTYFLSGASHNFLTYNPHMLHHSQAAMHNFSVWNPHTHILLSLTQIREYHCHITSISKFYFQVPMPSKTGGGGRDPKLIYATMYLVRNISRNTNKTLTV
jgi:hypothetical protein